MLKAAIFGFSALAWAFASALQFAMSDWFYSGLFAFLALYTMAMAIMSVREGGA